MARPASPVHTSASRWSSPVVPCLPSWTSRPVGRSVGCPTCVLWVLSKLCRPILAGSGLGSTDSCSKLSDRRSLAAASVQVAFDTGASSHMTSNAGILSRTLPSRHSPSHIVVGNGNLIPVTSTGTTHLSHNLSLNNVLVLPSLIKDLIYVRQFTTDNNCFVEFDPFGCSMKDLPTRREIIRCDSSGPLYPL